MPKDVEASADVTSAPSAEPRRATLEQLQRKAPKREEFALALAEGEEPVSFLFVAIGSHAYDDLLTKHPPTAQQRAGGATFNMDTFAPALLTKVCQDPAIDAAGWASVWGSDNWGRGEVSALFWRAVDLCNKAPDPAPFGSG